MIFAALTSPLTKYAVAAAAAAGILFYTYNAGKEAERVEQLKEDVEAFKERNKINENVADMDDVAICLSLGGVLDECEQLRGMDSATEDQ